MQPSQATPPAPFAGWLDDTNDITRAFLAAGQIPGLINIAGGLPDPQVYPVDALAAIALAKSRASQAAKLREGCISRLIRVEDSAAARVGLPWRCTSALQAAQMGSAAGSSRTLMAQQQARAATRAAGGQGDDDPDDPKAGDGKGVKFSERL